MLFITGREYSSLWSDSIQRFWELWAMGVRRFPPGIYDQIMENQKKVKQLEDCCESEHCPLCGQEKTSSRCKSTCKRCGYFDDCSRGPV